MIDSRPEHEDEMIDFIEDDLHEEIEQEILSSHTTSSVKKSESNILLREGQKFAAGLTWLTVDEVEQPGAAIERAKQFSADFLCSRLFVSQTGYGYLSKGHRMGMPSVAAIIADALVGEWHGVFVADNGWIYVAVHADTIAPEGDILFSSEEDAYNHFVAQAELFKWPKTYVPEEWTIENNDGEITLDQILDDAYASSLRPVNLDGFFSGSANKNIAFMCLASFIIIAFLTFFSENFFDKLFPERLEANRPQIETSNKLIVPPKEPELRDDSLLQAIDQFKMPHPNKVLEKCVNSFGDLMVSLPGWGISRMRCRNGFVESLWTSQKGNIDTIKPYLDKFPFGVNTTLSANGEFIASMIVKNSSRNDKKVKLASREDILIALNDRFSKIGRLDVRDIIPQADANVDGGARRFNRRKAQETDENKQYTIEDLSSLEVVFTTQSPPQNFVNSFDLPGLKFNTIEWSLENGVWVYNMQIYLAIRDTQLRTRIN